ncbi:hypothetical protein Rs2_15911 [Raphanus sativus]|nr:hypothetical protein Rs2_15911 [Raphanus sativus]
MASDRSDPSGSEGKRKVWIGTPKELHRDYTPPGSSMSIGAESRDSNWSFGVGNPVQAARDGDQLTVDDLAIGESDRRIATTRGVGGGKSVANGGISGDGRLSASNE